MHGANPDLTRDTASLIGTIQGIYPMPALRALRLDVDSMSGFDAVKMDTEFFASTNLRTNWLVNVGYGEASNLHPSVPQLEFDGVATVL